MLIDVAALLPVGRILVGLILTAAIILAFGKRHEAIIALAIQYILVAVLVTEGPYAPVGLVKLTAGLVVVAVLSITLRRGEMHALPLPLRLAVLAVAGIAAYSLQSYAVPTAVPPMAALEVGLAGKWLIVAGLLTAIIWRDPLRAGLGLLTFSSGFQVLYGYQEISLSVAGLLGIIDVIIALGVAYLTSQTTEGAASR
jgi:hypothetical protein